MYFVQCPRCGAVIELPDDAVGADRNDPWNVVDCGDCDVVFDYDDDEVRCTSDTPASPLG